MALTVRTKLEGDERFRRALARLSPEENPATLRRGLTRIGLLVQKVAAEEKIARGGVSGRGRNRRVARPLPDRLTSRTGALRRSIGLNRVPLPHAIEVGTELIYGAVHELGLGPFPPRPFLGPAIDDSIREMEQILADEWLREVNRA